MNFLKHITVIALFIFSSSIVKAQDSTSILKSWSFDSLLNKRNLSEQVENRSDTIIGWFSLKNGIKGKSFMMDGYSTKIKSSAIRIKHLDGFSAEAWLALQTYPWNNSPVVNQGTLLTNGQSAYFEKDFFVGVDAHGKLIFELNSGDSIFRCASSEKLPLLCWNHITTTYSSEQGMRLYINGRLAGELKTTGTPEFAAEELWLGMNMEKMSPSGTERKASENIYSKMVLHGLLDEVKIYSKELSPEEAFLLYSKNVPSLKKPLDFKKLPSGPDSAFNSFGAYYTRLYYTEEWEDRWKVDEFPDILVHFDRLPIRYIF